MRNEYMHRFCNCKLCGEKLVVDKVLYDEKTGRQMIKTIFTPNKREAQVLLNDGSQMRVLACVRCYDIKTQEAHTTIMVKVKSDWKDEMANFSKLTKRQQKDLSTYQDALHIIVRSDKMSKEQVEKRFKKFKDDNVKRNKKEDK